MSGASKKLNHFLKSAALITALQTPVFATQLQMNFTWDGGQNPFAIAAQRNAGPEKTATGKSVITLRRQHLSLSPIQMQNSLALSFTGGVLNQGRNFQAEITRKSYRVIKFPDSIDETISFEQPGHNIWMNVPNFLFLQDSQGKDFSIFLRIRPYELRQRMQLLRKISLLGGTKKGLLLLVENGGFQLELLNVFKSRGNLRQRVAIRTLDRVQINKFYNLLFTYNQSTGALTSYLDGIEQQKIYLTHHGRKGGEIDTLEFPDNDPSPLIIGRGFLGAIDDLVIGNEILGPQATVGLYPMIKRTGGRFIQKTGIIDSKIFYTPYSGSSLTNLFIEKEEPTTSRVKVFVRSSTTPFHESDPEYILPFEEVRSSNINIKGRYFQYRLELFASMDGKHAPAVHKVRFDALLNPPPLPPRGLEVAETGKGSVTLRFFRNAEMDVINGGRYHVYYGLKPGEALGILRYKKISTGRGNRIEKDTINDREDRLVTDDLRYQNRIQITIDNEMIKDNIKNSYGDPAFHGDYPLLDPDVPFYFWITACDNFYSDSPESYDHESLPSEAVLARPD